MKIVILLALACILTRQAVANGLDLIVPDEGRETLKAGLHEFRTVSIGKRATLVVDGAVDIACEKFLADEGASIIYQPTAPNGLQDTLSIDTLDASGLKFLYIAANGQNGASRQGMAATGSNGRNARSPNFSHPRGKSSQRGGPGAPGLPGFDGHHGANVKMHLPNLKPGSLLRIHANGGNGGAGQRGGRGGKGGNGATFHPPSNGGPGGPGGKGGSGGNAGKIVVYLVVSDSADEAVRDAALRTIRLEPETSGGHSGASGLGGPGGEGGNGAFGGGDGSSGSGGSMGSGAPAPGQPGIGPNQSPTERWVVIDIVTESDYAKEYLRFLQTIRAARAGS